MGVNIPLTIEFQPALPMRGVTRIVLSLAHAVMISTRTPHAGSDVHQRAGHAVLRISTRTPHAGSDAVRQGA